MYPTNKYVHIAVNIKVVDINIYKSSLEGFFVTNKRTAEVTVVRVPNNQPNIDLDRLNHIG